MKRITFIDIAKGIGILLVLIGHVSQNNLVNEFIYSFHMPLFFIISGFLYKERKDFVKRRIKTILVPYIIFSLLCYIYWFLIERNLRSQNINPINPFINIFLAQGGEENYIFNVALWFLPCLFITEIIFNFLRKRIKNEYVMATIICIISILGYIYSKIAIIRLPFLIDTALIAISFYYIGTIYKKLYDKNHNRRYEENINKNICINLINIIVLFVILIISVKINGTMNMNGLKFNSILPTYISAISGSFIVINLSKIISKNKFLEYIGKNTLIIMCIHEPIKRIIIGIISKIIKIPDDALRMNFIWIILITIILLIIMLPFINIINRYLPFLIGKKQVKEKQIKEKQIS